MLLFLMELSSGSFWNSAAWVPLFAGAAVEAPSAAQSRAVHAGAPFTGAEPEKHCHGLDNSFPDPAGAAFVQW